MPELEIPKGVGDGEIDILDGGVLSYRVTFEDGDFDSEQEKPERVVVHDRNDIVGALPGKSKTQKISWTVDLRQFTDSTSDTIIDVIEGTGTWAAMVSDAPASFRGNYHAVRYRKVGTAGETDGTITRRRVFLNWKFKENDRTKIVVTGEVFENGRPTRTGR